MGSKIPIKPTAEQLAAKPVLPPPPPPRSGTKLFASSWSGEAHQWSVNDLIRLPTCSNRYRIWRVTGIFPGGEQHESVVELEALDRNPCTEGRMCVPVDILDALLHSVLRRLETPHE